MQATLLLRFPFLAMLSVVLIVCSGCGVFRGNDASLTKNDVIDRRRNELLDEPNGVSQASYTDSTDNQQEENFQLSDLSPSKFTNYYKNLTGQGIDPQAAKKLYLDAEGEFRQAAAAEGSQRNSSFAKSAKTYQRAAKKWPDSALEQDAMFMIGESYFFADYYPKANESYEQLLKKYPNSRHLDVVEARRFSMARYWLDVNRANPQEFYSINWFDKKRPSRGAFSKATKVFDKIRHDDSTGQLADDATMAAANAHFEAGDFATADDFYTDLRLTFPSSEHQFKAHLLGVKTKLETYRGPEYDSSALDGADQLLKQIRRQFRPQAHEHEEYISRAEREVRYHKAAREWKSARYYDRRGEYGGSRFYYETILQDYSDTPFAQQARERLGEISDRPPTPPQRLSWLVDLFPEAEEAKPLIAGQGTTRR